MSFLLFPMYPPECCYFMTVIPETTSHIDTLRNMLLFSSCLDSLSGPRPLLWGSSIILILGGTHLNEWSARRRDLYLTTHNNHKTEISMPPTIFEPATPTSESPQANALKRAATGIIHIEKKLAKQRNRHINVTTYRLKSVGLFHKERVGDRIDENKDMLDHRIGHSVRVFLKPVVVYPEPWILLCQWALRGCQKLTGSA